MEEREVHFIVSGSCYLCIAKKFRDDGTSSLQGAVGTCGVRSKQTRDGQRMTGLLPIGPRSNSNEEEQFLPYTLASQKTHKTPQWH